MTGNDEQIFDKRLWVALVLALALLAVAAAKQRSHDVSPPVRQLTAAGDVLHLVSVTAGGKGQGAPTSKTANAGTTPFFFAPVPVNSADRDLLMTLPGIGPAMADRIIAFRVENGPIRDAADFSRVRGIGPVRLQNLQGLLCFE